MVEEMLAARGIGVSYETVRQWAHKFGRTFSDQIRQRAPARGDKNGIWMKSSSRSRASPTGFGARSTSMVSFSMFWCSAEETASRRGGS